MEKRYFTVEDLARELREYEREFELSTDELLRLYRTREVPPRVPRHDAFVWASTARMHARMKR